MGCRVEGNGFQGEPRPTGGDAPLSSPHPKSPVTRPDPSFCRHGDSQWGKAQVGGSKEGKPGTVPALSQVLYFPEVMAKGREVR